MSISLQPAPPLQHVPSAVMSKGLHWGILGLMQTVSRLKLVTFAAQLKAKPPSINGKAPAAKLLKPALYVEKHKVGHWSINGKKPLALTQKDVPFAVKLRETDLSTHG